MTNGELVQLLSDARAYLILLLRYGVPDELKMDLNQLLQRLRTAEEELLHG